MTAQLLEDKLEQVRRAYFSCPAGVASSIAAIARSTSSCANTPPRSIRLPDELIARLDAYAKRLSEQTQLSVTRADVVMQRVLTRCTGQTTLDRRGLVREQRLALCGSVQP